MSLWTETSRALVVTTKLFKLFKVGFRSDASAKEGLFDVLETYDWMNVVPVTPDGNVIMVRQFRYGTKELSLEFPAGVVEPGEAPLKTAVRELSEETGATAKRVWATGSVRPNPAIMGNTCYLFAAEGVEITGETSFDAFEEIETVLVPLDEVDAKIASGEISHALTIAAWHFYRRGR